MPSMTTAQQVLIVTPATGLEIYNTDVDAPMYNHSVDGWIPTGRYAGNPYTGAGAKAAQWMGSTLDGELIPVRLIGAGSQIYPGSGTGTYSHNSVNLGTAGQNFLYGHFNRTYVQQCWIGPGTNVISATNSGSVGGGMRFSSGSSQYFLKIHGHDEKGVSVRDTEIGITDIIDASAVMEIQSTTRGFLPPRMTTVQMNAIATPATGLMIYDTDTNQWMGYDGTSWVIIG
tara:strand:- start:284 stop:970 length:687 start_codon:yes stop_codon:yes gene_type:complete